MTQEREARFAVVIPVGPGRELTLDTLDSVEACCSDEHRVVMIDDCTTDGTYEALVAANRPHWDVVRNPKRHGYARLAHMLSAGYRRVLGTSACRLVLRLDQDALIIKPGLDTDALEYMRQNPAVGIFGVYEADYDRPRDFKVHRRLIDKESALDRQLSGTSPFWLQYLERAERNGYRRGDNVFGGAYFITRPCLEAIERIGGLAVPMDWNSRLQEDVYFSMLTVAAGYRMGHFAAPDGPLCLEWRGLPYPAAALAESKFKLVHSVDKGKNTSAAENGGRSPREIFRELRPRMRALVE